MPEPLFENFSGGFRIRFSSPEQLPKEHGALNGALNKEFFALIQASPGIQRKDLVEKIGISGRSADRCIAELVSEGKIERRGSKKTGGYWIR